LFGQGRYQLIQLRYCYGGQNRYQLSKNKELAIKKTGSDEQDGKTIERGMVEN